MGELSELMLTGELCEACGQYLGGAAFDVPLLCDGCAKDRRRAGHDVQRAGPFWIDCGAAAARVQHPHPAKVPCPACGKMVKQAGLKDHTHTMHGAHAQGAQGEAT